MARSRNTLQKGCHTNSKKFASAFSSQGANSLLVCKHGSEFGQIFHDKHTVIHPIIFEIKVNLINIFFRCSLILTNNPNFEKKPRLS